MTEDMNKIAGFIAKNGPNFVATIDAVVMSIGKTAEGQGWHDDKPGIEPHRSYYKAGKLALIHSEISEALEEIRTGTPEGEEIADVIIRCFDYCFEQDIAIGNLLIEKMMKNTTRERRHGGKKL